jgi:hypothetical protein
MTSPVVTERQARISAITHSGVATPISSRPRLATASTTKPASTVARTVKRPSSRGPSAVDSPVIRPCGAMARPATSALRPCTDWTNTGSRKTAPQVTTVASADSAIDSAGTGCRASEMSRAGWSRRTAHPT